MVGTMMTLQSEVNGSSVDSLATHWIPRVVRCRHCGSLSREEMRERMNDDEMMVRYECGTCRQTQTRHYFESQLGTNK